LLCFLERKYQNGKNQQDETNKSEEFVPPDGGRGWLVCLASFWVNGVVFGMLNTFGILLPHMSQLADTEENVTTKVCECAVLLFHSCEYSEGRQLYINTKSVSVLS